jgi:simple sugar transport system ATP-binding protein
MPSPAPSAPDQPIRAPHILLKDITVRFGAVTALDVVSLELTPGVRHAVVGENGAGKSTLMKALFGLLTPDAGEILVDGTPRRFTSPADAIALGIGMVHQHFELVPPFTVAENIVLGSEPTSGIALDTAEAAKRVASLAERCGLPLDPMARVADLSVAAQQRVEIVKALYREARILILDEPTAVLAPAEARDLWAATERLAAAGTTIVFITHKLDEVMAHADHVAVLRRGKRVYDSSIGNTTPEILAGQMIGTQEETSRAVVSMTEPGEEAFTGGVVLALKEVTVRGHRGETAVSGATLEVRAGEIVGLAGVDGSGQVELIEAVMGLRTIDSGTVALSGNNLAGLSVAARREAGIGYVPEDRHHRALLLSFSCEENAVLGRHHDPEFSRGGWLQTSKLGQFLTEKVQAFDVRGASVGLPARSLSGGNQQKLVLARELSRKPRLLLASQPTRGLDFAATAFVHDALRAERNRGAAVLVQSLDLDEVLAVSDRVAVMLAGRIVAVLDRAEATESRVGALMTGAETA